MTDMLEIHMTGIKSSGEIYESRFTSQNSEAATRDSYNIAKQNNLTFANVEAYARRKNGEVYLYDKWTIAL